MDTSHGAGGAGGTAVKQRRAPGMQHSLAGVSVREEDIEPVKGIRAISMLFRGMSVLLVVLAMLQVVFGLTSTVPISIGVLAADAIRLLIFAGLLWGAGDLAVLWVKSHHDLRATRILMARVAYMLQKFEAERSGDAGGP